MLPPITSLQNPRVKQAVKLRERHGRDDQRRIIIDGQREIERALTAGVRLRELFIAADILPPDVEQQWASLTRAGGGDVLDVSDEVMHKLSYGQRHHEGVVATAETPATDLTLFAGKLAQREGTPLIAVLEGVEKPGNLGAILRTADAAGVTGLIAASPRTDLYNPNAIRASLGAIFTVPIAAASSAECLAWLRERQFSLFAARVDGAVSYTSADFRRPTAIILGSEAAGLTSTWHAPDIQALKLPMLGSVDSLNVSVTAAVLFYEVLRQRSEA